MACSTRSPCLAWFHAQSLAGPGRGADHERTFLGEATQLQFRSRLAALLAVAVAWPEALVYPAALALGASAMLLEANLLRCCVFSRRCSEHPPSPDEGSW
jgi:hypothetical protein